MEKGRVNPRACAPMSGRPAPPPLAPHVALACRSCSEKYLDAGHQGAAGGGGGEGEPTG